jgi:hypothetical protein
VPIDWLTYRNGLPKPGGATQPPPLDKIPNLEENEPTEDADAQAAAAAAPRIADAVNAAAQLGLPAAPDDPVSDSPPPAPTAKARLAALPGNPAFVGGFGAEHPNIAMAVMGDGSVRAVTRNISRAILQSLANRSDGKLQPNDF